MFAQEKDWGQQRNLMNNNEMCDRKEPDQQRSHEQRGWTNDSLMAIKDMSLTTLEKGWGWRTMRHGLGSTRTTEPWQKQTLKTEGMPLPKKTEGMCLPITKVEDRLAMMPEGWQRWQRIMAGEKEVDRPTVESSWLTEKMIAEFDLIQNS